MYQFTDDLRIGIPEIDEEHRQLFALVNEVLDALSLEDADFRQLALDLLDRLKKYAATHFAHEEEYMKKIHDPELSSQQQEHQDFVTYVNTVHMERLDNERVKPAFEELLKYLSNWLFRHIIGSDALIGHFESPFAFTSKYITGIEFVDREHEKLFEIIRDADRVIHAELLHDKYDEIMRILSGLKDYAREHFTDEENYMKEIQYPGLEPQQRAHATFIDKLTDINLDEIDNSQQDYLERLVRFLLEWLSVHILHMDKKIGEFAQAGELPRK